MNPTERELTHAHKLLAEAAGCISGMLARKKLNPQEIRTHLPRIEYAMTVLYKLQETRNAPREGKATPGPENHERLDVQGQKEGNNAGNP